MNTATPETDWAAMDLRSHLARSGITIDPGHSRGLVLKRFSAGWVQLLLASAENAQARDPEAMVAKWLRTGRWDDQVLYAIANRIGLWDTLSRGGRFNRCRELRKRGLQPWTLAAIWNGVLRIEAIENPLAFLGAILKRGEWVRFEAEVHRRELTREVSNTTVVAIVQDVIRRQADKLLDGAWSES
jgi:hypothetical protein